MKTLYLDCFAGIAGDMFLGALLDLGLDCEEFKNKLRGLNVDGYHLQIERKRQDGFMGTDVKVLLDEAYEDHHAHAHEHEHVHEHGGHHHSHRGLHEIKKIISESNLSDCVKEQSLNAFTLLAEAEGSVHGIAPEEVHFHEVGAIDSIVDIVGSFVLLEMLGVERICSSRVNVGSGTVKCMHGVLPVPAPATAILLKGIPVFADGEPMERTTPTGALLLRVLCNSYGAAPAGVILKSGYGFGDRQSDLPNMLRVSLIETEAQADKPYSRGTVVVMETNIDDMNPQDYQLLEEYLFNAGALDVFFTPIMMKKMRPAVRLTCIAPSDKYETMGEIILRHSTSIGVRWTESNRMTLRRRIVQFKSSLGEVAMKLSNWGEENLHATPEYEDLRRISNEKKIPLNRARALVMSEFVLKEGEQGETKASVGDIE